MKRGKDLPFSPAASLILYYSNEIMSNIVNLKVTSHLESHDNDDSSPPSGITRSTKPLTHIGPLVIKDWKTMYLSKSNYQTSSP